MTPHIQSISLSPIHGFSKQPQTSLSLIAGEGIEGDAHRGVTTQHLYLKHRNPALPNLCQVHLFAAEMLEELAAKGFMVVPGDLGENILTVGIDLLALPLGTRLYLGHDAVVEVTGLRTPCIQIDRFRPGLLQHMWGGPDAHGKKTRRAGIMSVVLHSGEVQANDSVHVELPPQPHLPLGPV